MKYIRYAYILILLQILIACASPLDMFVVNNDLLKTSQVGMMVYDLTDDAVLYQYNARLNLRPASTQKLFTVVTALDKLGAEHAYKTTLLYSPSERSLYLKGEMDPTLSSADIDTMASLVSNLHVDTIMTLYGDRSFKDAVLLGEGWCWDDDNPELSPLVYKRKDVLLQTLAEALRTKGITILKGVGDRTAPQNADTLCVIRHTIAEILPRMLKNSDNMYAESMLYHLGCDSDSSPFTAKQSIVHINALLSRIGETAYLADGSGLSLYNYTSAATEVALLRYAYSKETIRQYLLTNLPVAGVDGTLKDRMRTTKAMGNVRAKTGTVRGVSSLAGYCTGVNGHMLAFSIINQGSMSSAPAKAFQDSVCTMLCKTLIKPVKHK